VKVSLCLLDRAESSVAVKADDVEDVITSSSLSSTLSDSRSDDTVEHGRKPRTSWCIDTVTRRSKSADVIEINYSLLQKTQCTSTTVILAFVKC